MGRPGTKGSLLILPILIGMLGLYLVLSRRSVLTPEVRPQPRKEATEDRNSSAPQEMTKKVAPVGPEDPARLWSPKTHPEAANPSGELALLRSKCLSELRRSDDEDVRVATVGHLYTAIGVFWNGNRVEDRESIEALKWSASNDSSEKVRARAAGYLLALTSREDFEWALGRVSSETSRAVRLGIVRSLGGLGGLGISPKAGVSDLDYHDFRLFYETEEDTADARHLHIRAALVFLDQVVEHGADQEMKDTAASARLSLKKAEE